MDSPGVSTFCTSFETSVKIPVVWEKPAAMVDVQSSEWGFFLQEWLPKMRAAQYVALIGDMGAGKTTFTREVVAALGGDVAQVSSPTFSLTHRYDTPQGRVHHWDLYRMPDTPQDHAQLFLDLEASSGLVLIEWADRFADVVDYAGMALRFYFIDLAVRRVYVYF